SVLALCGLLRMALRQMNLASGPRLNGSSGPRREVALPSSHIDPSAELETHTALDSGKREAELLVQRDAGVVGKRDPGDRRHHALSLEQIEMGREQLSPETATLRLRRKINAGLRAPAIGRAIAHRRRRGIADDPRVGLGDEPRMDRVTQ